MAEAMLKGQELPETNFAAQGEEAVRALARRLARCELSGGDCNVCLLNRTSKCSSSDFGRYRPERLKYLLNS
jgi:hypothetical protein